MKLSTGFRTHAVCFTAGGSTRATGWKAHQSAPFRFPDGAADETAASFGHTAPAATQFRTAAICSSASFRPGGIFSPPVCSIACTTRLPGASEGFSAAPRFPPCSIASRVATDKPLDFSDSL